MKLSKAVDLFWLDKRLEMSPRTVKTYSYNFRYLVECTGDKDIESITYTDILSFINYLCDVRKMGNRSIHDAIGRISSLWTWASQELSIPHIFKDKKPKIKYTDKTISPLTQADIKGLIAATEYKVYAKNGKKSQYKRATALLDKAMILTLLDSGARVTELCDWQIKDYDDKTGRLLIRHGKGDKERFVVLGNRARKAVFRYLAERNNLKSADPLFATRENTHFDKDNVRHKLERLAKTADVSNVHPHRFRHTFAINFLRNGGNIFVLQSLLGHATLEMVKHYARIADIDIEDAIKHSPSDKWRL